VWKSYLGALVGWPIRGNGDGRKRVGKMCTTGEKFADELLTDVLETWTTRKITEFFRARQQKYTQHLRRKMQAAVRAASFSTNPQRSSQQQGAFLFCNSLNSCFDDCVCEYPRLVALPPPYVTEFLSPTHFHSPFCALRTSHLAKKRVQYASG
jgi:hypothetical protein